MTDLYRFHVNLFAAPWGAAFDVTWEEAAGALERLPQLIFELDGSFVFSGTRAGPSADPTIEVAQIASSVRWQVDGHLFDFADRLHRVELHGDCPAESFDRLLACFGWPRQPLLFESVREGDRLDEVEFRTRAGKNGAGDGPAR